MSIAEDVISRWKARTASTPFDAFMDTRCIEWLALYNGREFQGYIFSDNSKVNQIDGEWVVKSPIVAPLSEPQRVFSKEVRQWMFGNCWYRPVGFTKCKNYSKPNESRVCSGAAPLDCPVLQYMPPIAIDCRACDGTGDRHKEGYCMPYPKCSICGGKGVVLPTMPREDQS